jgi:hypothetical protein
MINILNIFHNTKLIELFLTKFFEVDSRLKMYYFYKLIFM